MVTFYFVLKLLYYGKKDEENIINDKNEILKLIRT